jgi:hypothetical protein
MSLEAVSRYTKPALQRRVARARRRHQGPGSPHRNADDGLRMVDSRGDSLCPAAAPRDGRAAACAVGACAVGRGEAAAAWARVGVPATA